MNDKVLEARRALFEDWISSFTGVAVEKISSVRVGDGYADLRIESAWFGFCAALDAVEIDLDSAVRTMPSPVSKGTMWSAEVLAAIESTNLGLRVK